MWLCHAMKNIKKSTSILSQVQSEQAIYLSDVSPKDKPWDKHRENSEKVGNIYSQLGNGKYFLRITKCSRVLEFALKQELNKDSAQSSDQDFSFKLTQTEFCRVRWCPVCQWRRSLMWKAKFYQAIPKIRSDYPNHQFIFLTLTLRTCEVENLKSTFKLMNKAWKKLVKRKTFPGIGWVKSFEITKTKNNLAHPHFHCIIIVPQSYFKSRTYLSKDKWISLWQKSLKVDYEPSIDVRKVKLKKSREKVITEKLDRELTDNEAVFHGLMECLKYSVKESDLISDPKWLDAITKQLHNTRAISTGGIFKQYLSEDEPEDLINVELEQNLEVLETDARFRFGWKEKVKRYQSI